MLLLLLTLESFCEDCHGCLPSVGAAVVGITSLKPLLPLPRSQLLLSVKPSNEAVCVLSELLRVHVRPRPPGSDLPLAPGRCPPTCRQPPSVEGLPLDQLLCRTLSPHGGLGRCALGFRRGSQMFKEQGVKQGLQTHMPTCFC